MFGQHGKLVDNDVLFPADIVAPPFFDFVAHPTHSVFAFPTLGADPSPPMKHYSINNSRR